MTNNAHLKELLFRMADDALILGHRNSEWTGLGPILEEDIAFSSMAQDKIGHAWALYRILNEELGEGDPDEIGFLREEKEYKCCQFVEYPIGEFDFSLMRQFLFDRAEYVRYSALAVSSFGPMAALARKVRGEIKYHVMHGDTWVQQLTRGTEEAKARMQSALNECFPLALGIFEPFEHEAKLIQEGVYPGESDLRDQWIQAIRPIIADAGLIFPDMTTVEPAFGGRKGYHTEYLKPLLDEMSEVVRSDAAAKW